ncbi:MAG: stalk domain-containing protein [Candidatus Poribacteria bacterium]|nr:stalk domain-containing protein [Candidatus Poribacteria bacterium]
MIVTRKLRSIVGLSTLLVLFFVMGVQMGFAEGDGMKKENFQVSIDARRVTFTAPPIFKNGTWLVPLKPFAEQLGLKIEYPEGSEMVVLCGGVELELCVPLRFQDDKDGALDIDGVTYVHPTHIAEVFGYEIYEASKNRLEVIHPAHLAPEFTLPDLTDTPRHLRDFRGKKTFLYVWGSW